MNLHEISRMYIFLIAGHSGESPTTTTTTTTMRKQANEQMKDDNELTRTLNSTMATTGEREDKSTEKVSLFTQYTTRRRFLTSLVIRQDICHTMYTMFVGGKSHIIHQEATTTQLHARRRMLCCTNDLRPVPHCDKPRRGNGSLVLVHSRLTLYLVAGIFPAPLRVWACSSTTARRVSDLGSNFRLFLAHRRGFRCSTRHRTLTNARNGRCRSFFSSPLIDVRRPTRRRVLEQR
jgi:hypothetical protein